MSECYSSWPARLIHMDAGIFFSEDREEEEPLLNVPSSISI